ncbi:MAG: hypothetical protein AB1486_33030 [Planctomycetota bacterium]
MNRGDFASGQPLRRDTELGEFFADVGGYVEFTRYDQIGHPYQSLKGVIKQFFFDLDQLGPYISPLPISPLYEYLDSGWVEGQFIWYLDNNSNRRLNWELGKINSAPTVVMWDSTSLQPPSTRLVLIWFQPGGNPHESPWLLPPGPVPDPPHGIPNYPREPAQQALHDGHIVLIVGPNRRPDVWVSLQRCQDMLRYMRLFSGRDEWAFSRAFSHGGSHGASQADKAALLGAKWCYGSEGGYWQDFGYLWLSGAWGKALMHVSSAFNQHGALIPLPPRNHSGDPMLMPVSIVRAAELTGNWEEGALSIPMRLTGPEGLQRPIQGPPGNCDIGENIHWWRDAYKANSKTSAIRILQTMAHGAAGIGINNRYHWYTGNELADLASHPDAQVQKSNPPIQPTALPDDPYNDPFHLRVYDHTLIDVPSASSWKGYALPDLLTDAPWDFPSNEQPCLAGPIGNGIFPGAFDSMRAGDFDSDGQIELVFGTFDGFVEVLEERTVQGQVLFVPEWRSPPLGYGVSALDVGRLYTTGPNYIVCASCVGRLRRIPITGQDSYGSPEVFPNAPANLSRGFISWLAVGELHYNTPGKEVLLQNEETEWILLKNDGTEMARTLRVPTPNASDTDNFTGLTGKPLVVFWPPQAPTASQVAFLPCQDGFLRRMYYQPGTPGKLTLEVASDYLGGWARCAYFWDPPGAIPPHIIVGTSPGDGHALWMVNPAAAAGSRNVAHIDVIHDGTDSIPLGNAVTIETFTSGPPAEILVGHGGRVTRVQLEATDPPGFIDPPGLTKTQAIVGVDTGEPPENTEFYIGPEVCSVERYTSGGNVRFAVSTPGGRVWVLNTSLEFQRKTDTLDLPSGSPKDWYSNRSWGHVTTMDLPDPASADSPNGLIWVHEAVGPYRNTPPPISAKFRLAALNVRTGTIDDFLNDSLVLSYPQGMVIGNAGTVLTPDYRTYFFEEAGTVIGIGSAALNRFTIGFRSREDVTNPDDLDPLHGHVFKLDGIEMETHVSRIGNFNIPIDETVHDRWDHTGGPPEGSLYPYVDYSARYSGQITTDDGIQGRRDMGNSVKTGIFRNRSGNDTPHVVTGLLGGFVYVIDPAQPDFLGLSYWTRDLGWIAMGLDVGNVEYDSRNEIVVGTFTDKGSLQDYKNDFAANNFSHNRGHLYILHPDAAPQELTPTDVDIAPPRGPHRFSLGVFGVKVDDINNDGHAEIWCGDGQGYVYALGKNPATQQWECFFRSRSLGVYAGFRNLIFPVKVVSGPDQGKTEYLVVVTPGYVYRFAVDFSAVPF